MAMHPKVLDLVDGVEKVVTAIEINSGGDIILDNIEAVDATISGQIVITNANPKQVEINLNTASTEDFNISIENTKPTLETGDILIYDTTNSTFKVDNISNYVTGTGNYHVLKVEFEANADFETTTILPVGSQIDKLVIRSNGLTTGIAPLQFLINGSTPVLLAEQGVEFDNTAGTFTIAFFADAIDLVLASGENGTFKSEWSGAGTGTGTGTAYLFYWTPLP